MIVSALLTVLVEMFSLLEMNPGKFLCACFYIESISENKIMDKIH